MKKVLNNILLEAVNRGIKLALDNFDNEVPIALSIGKVKINDQTTWWLDVGLYIVDLGLPSGTIWCKYNFGVDVDNLKTAKDWYGSYYAWAELEEKRSYDWETYKYAQWDSEKAFPYITKYCTKLSNSLMNTRKKLDNLTKLELSDDVVYQTDNRFLIPSKEQYQELLDNCKWSIIDNYNNISGLNGVLFKSNINGNEIFFPFAGNKNLLGKYEKPTDNHPNVGERCWYWTSDLGRSDHNAGALNISAHYTDIGGQVNISNSSREGGYCIRGILRL